MAAHRLGSTVPNAPHLSSNRYHHASEESRLPTGRCNYTNLSVGGNAPTCGCRRFWDKASQGGDASKSGFCMCEHHACFHSEVPEGYTSTPVVRQSGDVVMSDGSSTILNTPLRQPRVLEQIRERDEREREDRDRQQQESTIPDTAQWGRYVHSGGSNLSLPAIPSQCLLPSETGSQTSGCGSAYLKPFGGLGLRALSNIPTPSAAARTQASGSGVPQMAERPMQVYEDAHGNGHLQSLTEVATPSARTSQDPAEDLGQNIASVQDALNRYAVGQAQTEIALRPVSKGSVHIKQSGSGPRVESLIPHDPDDENLLPRIKHVMGQLMDYPNKIQNHEHRLEQLENVSFSNAHIDDLRDDFEKVDGRVDDLEEKFCELDRQVASINDGSVCGRQHITSFDCRESVTSSAMIVSAIDRVDVSRVEALEAQVAELQASALPSHARPWEVEVVFIPFGSRLMGVWSSQHGVNERTRLGSTMTDEWTQTQHSLAAAQKMLTAYDHSTSWERSATHYSADEEDRCLFARACGRGSRVDERLRSRGLVKLIQVCGTEARDVQVAITKAFNELPDTIAKDPYTPHDENASSIPKSLKPYHGLTHPWIPLRKLHKNSLLRFLTPSEMVTPSLWTVPFLSSSVVMRNSKFRRLYITHRDAYMQQLPSSTLTSWTWQKLRQLPRIYPESDQSFSEQHHTPEGDAHEPCWEYDERLDVLPSSKERSISENISQLSISRQGLNPAPEEELEPASPSDHFSSAAVSRHVSTTPTSVTPSPVKIRERNGERRERDPFRRPSLSLGGRTVSMPSVPIQISTKPAPHANNKRRITSFERERDYDREREQSIPAHQQSPTISAQALQLKRRRTKSPSKDPQHFGLGMRFSAGPPSPFTFVDELAAGAGYIREGKGKERERGMTPFAYATPHSNAPCFERGEGEGEEISVYEDESVAGDENLNEFDDGDDGQQEFEVGMGYEDEGSIDPDDDFEREVSLSLTSAEEQERQLEELELEELEWEGVQESNASIGLKIGSPVLGARVGVYEDGDEDEEGDESDVPPSEYPSTQRQEAFLDGLGLGSGLGLGTRGSVGAERERGFRIHVDEDYEDDELV